MFQFDINRMDVKKVHFIGIGGVSMSGIAELLHAHGYEVTGSDIRENKYVKHLESIGIPVMIGQKAENISDQELFIYTDAILPQNEELQAAIASRKPCVTRGQFLGALMRNYSRSIAVSGSHGKSTTTSMIADILIHTEDAPTILLGGSLDDIGGNALSGEGDLFLAEACEYKGNIRYYYPHTAIILNIDEDHLDYYKNLENIVEAFERYMENIPEDGFAVINADDSNTQTLASHVKGRAITYSTVSDAADYYATDIHFDDLGHPTFTLHFPDGTIETYTLQIIGRFNINNAIAAIIATRENGISMDAIRAGIENYRSLHRRMEYVGDFKGARVLTDYGHHPVEIMATLGALSEYNRTRLLCVFQPYTISRTKTLMDEFARAFSDSDLAVVTAIQVAREIDTGEVRSEQLVEKINENGDRAVYQETFQDVIDYLDTIVKPGDVILTTGCGDIDQLADRLAELGRKEAPAFESVAVN